MMADKETFCSSRQQDVGTGLIDRLARSAHTLDGERQLVKRRRWITGRLPSVRSRQEPWQRSRRPARGRGFGEMVLEGVRAFGAHRYSRCRLRASSLALDQDQVEAGERL